jgi:hypothetical protein
VAEEFESMQKEALEAKEAAAALTAEVAALLGKLFVLYFFLILLKI